MMMTMMKHWRCHAVFVYKLMFVLFVFVQIKQTVALFLHTYGHALYYFLFDAKWIIIIREYIWLLRPFWCRHPGILRHDSVGWFQDRATEDDGNAANCRKVGTDLNYRRCRQCTAAVYITDRGIACMIDYTSLQVVFSELPLPTHLFFMNVNETLTLLRASASRRAKKYPVIQKPIEWSELIALCVEAIVRTAHNWTGPPH